MEVTRAAIIDDEPARRRPQDADDLDPDDRDPGDDLPALRDAWRRHHRALPPRRLSRDLLMRAVAYKLQEQVHGGLSKAARRRLRALVQAFAETGRVAPDNGAKVRPGTRLVREWRGRTHVVTATESGFDYDGEAYGSLTAIAQRITGAHWSGPRFFGLRPSGESASAAEHG